MNLNEYRKYQSVSSDMHSPDAILLLSTSLWEINIVVHGPFC